MSIEERFQKELGNDYEVKRTVNTTPQNVIWLARQISLNRMCAVKQSRSPEREAVFKKSAEALARIKHKEHVVEVYGLIKDKYLVMEHVEGGSLVERLSFGRMELEEAIGIAKQVCEGLIEVHEQVEAVHCDVTPSNILFTLDDVVKLADLGLARKSEAATKGTYGTPGYFAPEQSATLSEGFAEPDFRADIYAVGVILYEMLSREHPFGDTARDTEKYKKMQQDDKLIAGLNIAGVPNYLMEIIRKCMQRDRTKRYGDKKTGENAARELLAALESRAYKAIDKLYDMGRRVRELLEETHPKYHTAMPGNIEDAKREIIKANQYIADNKLRGNEEAATAFDDALKRIAERRVLDYNTIFNFVYKGYSAKGKKYDPPEATFIKQMAQEPEKRKFFTEVATAWGLTHNAYPPGDKKLQPYHKQFIDSLLK